VALTVILVVAMLKQRKGFRPRRKTALGSGAEMVVWAWRVKSVAVAAVVAAGGWWLCGVVVLHAWLVADGRQAWQLAGRQWQCGSVAQPWRWVTTAKCAPPTAGLDSCQTTDKSQSCSQPSTPGPRLSWPISDLGFTQDSLSVLTKGTLSPHAPHLGHPDWIS
jgi:hypothetical protein